MTRVKRIALVLAAVMTGLVGATVVAVPAQAAWSCPTGLICFYWGANGVGSESTNPTTQYNFNISLGGLDYRDIEVGEPVRSNASSIKNMKANSKVSKLWTYPSGCFDYFNTVATNITQGGTYNIPGSVNNNLVCFRVTWA